MNTFKMRHPNGDTKQVYGRKEMAALLACGYKVTEYLW